MKKLFLTMLTILSCGAVYALPVGNPAEASLLCDGLIWEGHCGCDPCDPALTWCDAFSVRAGFYGDYVFNRHMRLRLTNGSTILRNQLERTSLYTNAGYVALNFWDRLDLFTTLGNTQIHLEGNVSTFGPFGEFISGIFLPGFGVTPGERVELDTNNEFSWSLGARGTLWECGCTTLGIEGQYFRAESRVKRITLADDASFYPTATIPHLRTRYTEWQVGVGLAHRIHIFVPYVAVKWSGARLQYRNNPEIAILTDFATPGITLNELRNKKKWGYAVGVSLVDCEKASLTVEGRFADEKALYVNSQIRF
jgi:major outer membrane protein